MCHLRRLRTVVGMVIEHTASPAAHPTPLRDLSPGSASVTALETALTQVRGVGYDLPCVIGGREIRTGRTAAIAPPHDRRRPLGHVHFASGEHVQQAIHAASAAAPGWREVPAEERS